MKMRVLAVTIALLVSAGAWADMPDTERVLKGAAGAAAGGLLGSQIGNGRGNTAATAVGAAAGAVVGSGCKPTFMSAIGGLIGGVFGSQVGGGDGQKVMAGVGAAVGAVAGSDCSEDEKTGGVGAAGAVGGYVANIGHRAAINGIALTEVGPDAFPMGKFSGFPRITSKVDFVVLDELSKGYAKASWEAAAQQDWEGFAVNRHLGMRIVEYRLHHKLAVMDFVKSLTASKDGTGMLAPGATVFLPGFTRWGGDAKVSGADYLRQILSANVGDVNWAAAPKVADLGDLLGILQKASDVLSGVGNAGIGDVAGAERQAADLLAQLPPGAVFSAHDAAGNTFLVERTAGGFNIGNPGGRPVAVPLGKLGFVPEMTLPNAARRNASPLVKRMQEVRHALFWDAMANRAGGGPVVSTTQAPNKIAITGSSVRGFFDAEGNAASDAAAIKAGEKAYKSNPSYKTALEMANYAGHKRGDFETACFSIPGAKAYDTDYVGEDAEILRHQCLNGQRGVLKAQEFYVIDGKTMQSVASLVQDQNHARQLQEADAGRNLAEAVVGFVPAVGSIDSATKCATGTSLTVGLSGVSSKLFGGVEKYRGFVSDLLPKADDPSDLEKSLTCAAAIPALGIAAKGVAKVSNWTGLFANWTATERGANALKALEFFDTNIVAAKNADELVKIEGMTTRSIADLKGFYDSIQVINGGNQAGQAAAMLRAQQQTAPVNGWVN